VVVVVSGGAVVVVVGGSVVVVVGWGCCTQPLITTASDNSTVARTALSLFDLIKLNSGRNYIKFHVAILNMEVMEELVSTVVALRNSSIRGTVDQRMAEFKQAGQKLDEDIFCEMCFCLMTANFNAERSMKIQDTVQRGFCDLPESELAAKLRLGGHRFPAARAKYMIEARKHKDGLRQTLDSFGDERTLRQWLADNVRGLGMKESSHFLRNIGYENLAIIDFHIIDLLVKHGLIERPKTLTRKRYLEIEQVLQRLADRLGMSLAELDLYLWYMETGKILK
jgi:N-glycosylase/DNA lyase